jgi:hypothetical protein
MLTDGTRWQIKPTTYPDLNSALADMQENYRRALWAEQDAYVEVWCEKDAIAGILSPITAHWDVPLMVMRGYPSLSFVFSIAEQLRAVGKPAFVYYFGDAGKTCLGVHRSTCRQEHATRDGARRSRRAGYAQENDGKPARLERIARKKPAEVSPDRRGQRGIAGMHHTRKKQRGSQGTVAVRTHGGPEPRPERIPVLIVASADGWCEVYAPEHVWVVFQNRVAVGIPEAATLADEILSLSLPRPHRQLYDFSGPVLCDQVRRITPVDEAERLDNLELLAAIGTEAAAIGSRGDTGQTPQAVPA